MEQEMGGRSCFITSGAFRDTLVYTAVNPLLNTLTECPNVPRELFYSKEMPILVEQGPYTFREVEKKVKQSEQGTRLGYGRPSPE